MPDLLHCRNSLANRDRLVSHSSSAFLHFDDQERLSRPKITRLPTFKNCQPAPQSPNARAPPSATCVAADMIGVSTYRCRIIPKGDKAARKKTVALKDLEAELFMIPSKDLFPSLHQLIATAFVQNRVPLTCP